MIKQPLGRSIDWRIFVISFMVALACACATTEGLCQSEYAPRYVIDGPSAYRRYVDEVAEYAPPSGRGPIVILISGTNGPDAYRSYAAEVARLGYYAVLLNGHSVPLTQDGEGDLRRAIERAQHSPKALPGQAAVIGFSMGGGGALTHAAHMPDLVSAVVAYYPMTIHVLDMRSFAARFQVPILVLAGEKDVYFNCCLIESMRGMEAAAKEGGALFELVVYPNAGHAFNLGHGSLGWFRAEESADAWQRTTMMLRQYQPLR